MPRFKVGDKVIPFKKYEEDWANPLAESFFQVLTVKSIVPPDTTSVNRTWTTYILSDSHYWGEHCLWKANKKNIKISEFMRNVHGKEIHEP